MNREVERSEHTPDVEAVFRREHLPLTVQRRVILELLTARHDHPTADQIFDDARHRLPGVSRTTVYRVLDTLVRVGLAVKTCHPGNTVRFDPKTERHHHLVCLECEQVIDLHERGLDRLRVPDTRQSGFEIRDYSIYYRGLCATCRRGVPRARPTGKAARHALR